MRQNDHGTESTMLLFFFFFFFFRVYLAVCEMRGCGSVGMAIWDCVVTHRGGGVLIHLVIYFSL